MLLLPRAYQLSPTRPSLEIELGLLDQLALVHDWTAHDQLDRALVGRRAQDLVEPGLELLGGQMLLDVRGHMALSITR